jgi:hypothetical protein
VLGKIASTTSTLWSTPASNYYIGKKFHKDG